MNTTLTALIVFGCLVGAIARKDSSSPPSRRTFDLRLEDTIKLAIVYGDHGGPGFGVAGELSKVASQTLNDA
jgi:hypothetical protein